MKKMFHALKKHWITAWLVIAVIGVVSFFAFAEYIEDSNRAKRVIANTTGAGDLFSSDYLAVGGESSHEVPFQDKDEEEEVTCYELPVRIWNYDASNPTFFYDEGIITYTLTAQLVKKTSSGYEVLKNGFTNDSIKIKTDEGPDDCTVFTSSPGSETEYEVNENYKYTVTQSYDGVENGYQVTYTGLQLFNTGRDENIIRIQFPKEMRKSNDKIYVKLTATPTPSLSSYNGLHNLSGYLSITEGKAGLSQGWSSGFNDKTDYDDYDGFNYVISGNGVATITFKWRDDKFQINPFFISSNASDLLTINDSGTTDMEKKIGSETDSNNIVWNYITINANSETTYTDKNTWADPDIPEIARKGIGRYDIQLYINHGQSNSYSWDETNANYVYNFVDCTV
ncbi:MAG: hypothetical protein IKW87_12770 [Ruminococcus sp.]|nr:hypothetical protein [Ruminococcus sp.]